MSETASRYQNALTYNPTRSTGTHLDGRFTPDFGFQQVASRAPVQFDPYIAQAAQYDGGGGGFGYAPSAPVSVVDQGGGGETNLLALVARYGPTALRNLDKARGLFGDDPSINSYDNSVPYTAPLPGAEGAIDSFGNGVGGFGDSFVSGQGGAASGVVPGGAAAPADSFANSVASYSGGADIAAGSAGQNAAGSLGYGGLVDGAAGGIGGAVGGYAGNYIGQSINDGRLDSRENGQIGAAIGGAIGSFIPIPVVGTLVGAYFGGLIGSNIGGEPNMPSAYAQGFYGPDGNFNASGVARGGGKWDDANLLAQVAPDYFAQRAAADGLVPNTGLAGQGYFFGGGAHDGEGGWFLQPNERGAGEVRPDIWGLYAGADASQGYAESGGYGDLSDPAYLQAAREQGVTPLDIRRPGNFDEALGSAYDRLRGWGYFTQAGNNPTPEAGWAAYYAKYGDPSIPFNPNFTPLSLADAANSDPGTVFSSNTGYASPDAAGAYAGFNAPGGGDGG